LIAAFANKTFRVSNSAKQIYTFDGFSTNGGLQTEKQEVEGKKSKTHIKGINLNNMQYNLNLKSSLGVDVRNEYDSWMQLMEAQTPYIFILGKKPWGKNKWLLTSVGLTETVVDGTGRIVEGKLSLQFEEYEATGSSKSGATSSSPGVSGQATIDVNKLVGDKASEKRLNVAMQRSLSKGLYVG
jgi:hypothetical protein